MKKQTILSVVLVVLLILATAAIALANGDGLTQTSVSLNGKDISTTENVTLKPLDTLEVSFKVKNTLNEKVIKITNFVLDENGDGDGYEFSIAEKTEFHLDAGQESQVQKITTTLPADLPEGKYTLLLATEGQTLDDLPLRTATEFNFTVKKEKAEIVVKLEPLPAEKKTLTCFTSATLTATITNTGKVAEDDVVMKVMDGSVELYNSAKMGVDLTLEPGESKTLALPVTITTEGQHALSVETGFNYINNIPGSTANTESVTLTKQACLSGTVIPTETDFKILDGKTVSFGVTANEGNYDNSVVWTVDGTQKGTGKNFNYKFSKAGTFTVKATLDQEAKTWKVTVADKPLDLAAFGWTQSQIDQLSNPASVKDLVLSTAAGTLTFSQVVDLSNTLYLDEVVKIGSNFVALDSVKAPGLNKPATVFLKNVDGKAPVKLYKYDGFADATIVNQAVLCPETSCTPASPQPASGFTFSVAGFSTYVAMQQKTAELAVPSEIVLDDNKTATTLSTSFPIQNLGTTESVKSIVFELSGFASTANAKLLNAPAELAPEESKTVTLQIDSSKNSNSGKKLVGTIKVSSDKGAKSIPVYINSKSFLTIDTIKINDKTTGKFSLVDENTVEVVVKNDYSETMDDVYVNVQILNVDGDDLEEESDTFKLSSGGDDDKVKVTFDLRDENVDKKQYTLLVTVHGKANDNTVHETTATVIVDVDVKSHDIIVKQAALLSGNAFCSQQYETLDVAIKNLGSNDEDNVEIRVKNSALKLDLSKKNIKLDKFSDSDSEYKTTFTIDLQKAAPGSYPLTIEVLRDGVLQTTSTVTLNIQNCGVTGAAVLGGSGETGQDALAKQLQEQLNAKLALNQPQVNSSLRDSSNYTLLLGGMVVLIFVALVLAMALIWRKR
ncbi:hypothetical protein HY495_00620 [Candidatus Woesearchaeota archaeon]|nr:hypothetical protein [Candidatus Woesearchaeota archaeon]